MPDAVGTQHYIAIMKAVIYSYLDKGMSPDQRIEDIWYSVFFSEVLETVDFESERIYIA